MSEPAVSVVIPSHARRLRLRWLLNALEEQTLPRERFEVIVVHDYVGAEAELVAGHPLAQDGTLRELRIEPGTGRPSVQRNMGWRAARAPLVAFIDDDCRADEGWLDAVVAAAEALPGAILQGTTRPDPFETASLAGPHARSLWVTPPDDFAQTCNIAYPRAVLEATEGFDEKLPAPAGEDTDLALRARAGGAPLEAVPDAKVFHAVDSYSLPDAIKLNLKWQHLAFVIKRHPQLRNHFTQRIFWRRSHRDLVLLLAGLAAARWVPPALLLGGPWVYRRLTRRGTHKRALVVGAVELPGGLVVDLAELVTMCMGSAKYRTLVL
ncbi:MAG TPA: glycosyltransferase [Thermoleophilaceae bacterium]|nr:glycosyltransferase [Thermoleophilaceae bacterium]